MLLRSGIATLLVLTALLSSPRFAAAQGPGDTNIFGGYSFLHVNDIEDVLSNFPGGFEVGITSRLPGRRPMLSIGGKLQFSYTSVGNYFGPGVTGDFSISEALIGVMFGPPADMTKKVWVFGMAHVGTTRLSNEFLETQNALTFQPGAGVGFFLGPNLGLQLTAELPIIRFEGDTSTGFRAGAQVTVRIR